MTNAKTMNFVCDIDQLAQAICPLYCRYTGQFEPQPAYISIDLRDGEIEADYCSMTGGAYPTSVGAGLVRRYRINAYAAGSALAELLRSDEFQALTGRIIAGGSAEWDDCNMVGRLNSDAESADEELQELIDDTFHPYGDNLAAVWDGEYILSGADLFDLWPDGKTLEQAAKELEAAAESEKARLEVDAKEFLMDEAQSYYDADSAKLRARLGESHLAAMLADGRIDSEELAEWREELSADNE